MSEVYLIKLSDGSRIELGEKATVGRSENCEVQLLEAGLSRSHGLFEFKDGALMYTDLGSSNGSYINGQKATQTEVLFSSDVITLGECKLEVHCPAARSEVQHADSDRTEFVGVDSGPAKNVPPMWSDSSGLESASQTQFMQVSATSSSAKAYKETPQDLQLPPIGDSPRLVVISESMRGQAFDLAVERQGEKNWNIGREDDSDIILGDDSVSGKHAQLINDGKRWKIVNWMSTNGTFVNGTKGLSTFLRHGDIIGVGNIEMAFELPNDYQLDEIESKTEGGLFSRFFKRFRK